MLKLRKRVFVGACVSLGGGEAREMRASQDFDVHRTRNSRHLKGWPV